MEEKPSFDKVWALFQEDREQMREIRERMDKAHEQDREQMREIRERMEKAREQDREQMKEAREQDREQMREIRERMDKAHEQDREQMREIREQMKADREQDRKQMKELSLHLGGIGNSNGAFAENYFYNSLNVTKQFGNEHFDRVDFNVKPLPSADGLQDEYDIVLLNGKSVAIVEVKYRAKQEHIAQTIHKATTFRQLVPAYKDFTFYLGLAGCSFDEDVEQYALNAGLAVLKQDGDHLVIYGEQLKKF